VVRSAVSEVPAKGRDTMGVVFARFASDDRIIAVARNSERNLAAEVDESADAVAEAVVSVEAVESDDADNEIPTTGVTSVDAESTDDEATGTAGEETNNE
jgi:DNA gyrase subunit A